MTCWYLIVPQKYMPFSFYGNQSGIGQLNRKSHLTFARFKPRRSCRHLLLIGHWSGFVRCESWQIFPATSGREDALHGLLIGFDGGLVV